MKRLSEDKEITSTIQMVYGPAGVGKTWYSASAPRSLLITDKNGIVTLKSPEFKKRFPHIDPYIIEVHQDEEPTTPKAFDLLRTKVEEAFEPKNIAEWDTLVIDDIDFARTAALNKGVVLNGALNKSKTAANARGGQFKDIMIRTQADFGTEMQLTENFIRELTSACREYKKNLIINAHERHQFETLQVQERTVEVLKEVRPMFTGRTAPDDIARYFDLVWYIRTTGIGPATKREFVTDKEGKYNCKNRWAGLFKNPEKDLTAEQVFKRIHDYQTNGTLP